MKRFGLGFILGLTVGSAVAAWAAPSLVGGNGFLWGWTVTVGTRAFCEDPFVWYGTREIECDRPRR